MLIFDCRKKGILIHISSGTADRPTPLATVYSASKVSRLNYIRPMSWLCKAFC